MYLADGHPRSTNNTRNVWTLFKLKEEDVNVEEQKRKEHFNFFERRWSFCAIMTRSHSSYYCLMGENKVVAQLGHNDMQVILDSGSK